MFRVKLIWIRLSASLWFLPLAMVGLAAGLAMGLIYVDVTIGSAWTSHHHLVFGIGAAGARGMLGAIAGSMMTVASLTFSLTISTLATASAQYTSRLVRNFMRDTVNQVVLGYFVSLFAYCLIVLRAIRGGVEGQFVPSIAVLGGLLLALISIIVLIYFIHHIAESIQASTILRKVTNETLTAIDRLFPADAAEPMSSDENERKNAMPTTNHRRAVNAGQFGFLQSVDMNELIAIAEKYEGLVDMNIDIGSFITPKGLLCELKTATEPDDSSVDAIRHAFTMGAARTVEQDAAFGIRQIVDIALKALSPGVNDTTTGVMCVEHLAVLLEAIAVRPIPSNFRAADGTVRVIANGRSYKTLVDLCLTQIRQSARGNSAVLMALLRAIDSGSRLATDEQRRAELLRQAVLVRELTESSIEIEVDRDQVLAMADRILVTPSDSIGGRW